MYLTQDIFFPLFPGRFYLLSYLFIIFSKHSFPWQKMSYRMLGVYCAERVTV